MDAPEGDNEKNALFKKPILIGKIGRLPRKIIPKENTDQTLKTNSTPDTFIQNVKVDEVTDESAGSTQSIQQQKNCISSSQQQQKYIPVPYKEPEWSGLPETSGKEYKFEVLKSGSIIESINLMSKSYWVFGRLANCDIYMQHPTISRYHAVLQYRSKINDDQEPGFYLYDLSSTHGTFLNKNRLKPKMYARVQVGHMIKLGCSTRTYLLVGPDNDIEDESHLTVTELKQKRNEELLKREEALHREKMEREERLRKEEERGIDWGMGEDAEDETDLLENPFAQANNEELYIEDPKKALRGFMEREGISWEYDCTEQGIGQFLCKVVLPIDDDNGRPIIAEILHKGKKKEAVVQCALEACRILDRYGLLRQAVHESHKRKAKNWEENDYYDSDEDTFLDRTGTIEKKRESRMKAKVSQQPETYESLLEKEKKLKEHIWDIEKQLARSASVEQQKRSMENSEEDTLDTFMQELKNPKLDKQKISKLRSELTKLKQEHATVVKLANIAKPANLPPLVSCTVNSEPSSSSNESTKNKNLPIFGKRIKLKVALPTKSEQKELSNMDMDEKEEEEDSTEEKEIHAESVSTSNIEECGPEDVTSIKKFEEMLKKINFTSNNHAKIEKVLNSLKKLATEEDQMSINWKTLSAKKHKIVKLMNDNKDTQPDEKLIYKILSELDRLLTEIDQVTAQKLKAIDKFKKIKEELNAVTDHQDNETCNYNEKDDEISQEELERKRKKNQRRIQQRQERSEIERQRGYQEDSAKEDYNMWVPPEGQSGDGRTSLNDKLGY